MTAPDDLVRRGDVLAILDRWIAGQEESARLKLADDLPGSSTEHEGSAAVARCIATAIRALPADPVLLIGRTPKRRIRADPVAEAAVAIVEHLFKFGVTSGDTEANRLCAAYRAAVAARAKEPR